MLSPVPGSPGCGAVTVGPHGAPSVPGAGSGVPESQVAVKEPAVDSARSEERLYLAT